MRKNGDDMTCDCCGRTLSLSGVTISPWITVIATPVWAKEEGSRTYHFCSKWCALAGPRDRPSAAKSK